MISYKITLTNKNSFFTEAEAYDIEGLIIVASTILLNLSKNMETRIENWAKNANIGDKYVNKKFTIDVCKVTDYD